MYGSFKRRCDSIKIIHVRFYNFLLIVLGQQRKESRNERVSTDFRYDLTADNGKFITILGDLESLLRITTTTTTLNIQQQSLFVLFRKIS